MEITMEQEELNLDLDKPIKFEAQKVIKVYPYDDDAWHLTYVVNPEDYYEAKVLLDKEYENWNRKAFEEGWNQADLEFLCDEGFMINRIFRVKHTYRNDISDPFLPDYTIG